MVNANQFSLRSVLIAMVGFSVLMASCRWVMGPVIPASKLRQISEGMSETDVHNVLGQPAREYENQWLYTRPVTPGWVAVYFHNGVVSYVDDESI